MSGADIPYQLRPNKFIDRQMFIDALARLVIPRGPEKYIYVSMGGHHLVDHYAIYNALGIQAQFSFDKDPNAVARQTFNRPTDATVCEAMNSADLPSKLDTIMAEFPSKRNVIVWLDYTSTDRGTQLQEVVQTLVRLQYGDIFRVTLNAASTGDKFKEEGYSTPAECRAGRLRKQIGIFMPTSISSIGDDEFHSTLTKCVELAVREAERLKPDLRIQPVLITSYKDSTRMLTVTCAISDATNAKTFPTKEFSKWKFASKNWSAIQSIYAPLLSSREQQRLDARLKRGPARMKSALPFLLGNDQKSSTEAMRSYRDFHRYYPTFRHVDD